MTNRKYGVILTLAFLFFVQFTCSRPALAQKGAGTHWRTATDKELAGFLPDRVPVVAERIEIESRTASAIIDEKGRMIAAAVLITAGYSSNGKYSDILLTQVPIKIADSTLPPGHYLLGWTRGEENLVVTFSEASSGRPKVTVTATKNPAIRGVQSIHIWLPSDLSVIQLGRFTIPYSLP